MVQTVERFRQREVRLRAGHQAIDNGAVEAGTIRFELPSELLMEVHL
jgi:hypothetical protein